jgi:aerobic-type carbon monoxide dehydrogenase small subunit (CoxS/CutS family)
MEQLEAGLTESTAGLSGGDLTAYTKKRIGFTVNGQACQLEIDARDTLAEVLREKLCLTGAKVGCNRAECGSCTVVLDGRAVFSCSVLAVELDGRVVQTVEGLADGDELHPLQAAFIEYDAVQCGICIPGILMALKGLLDHTLTPTEDQIQHAIAGNLCRCGTYPNTVKATLAAAAELRARKAEAS